jgi:hypothetical protein
VRAVRHILDSLRDTKLKGLGIPSGIFTESDGRETRMYFLDNSSLRSTGDFEALAEVRSILGQAYERCRADGATFLVIFIPTKFRVYSGFTKFDPAHNH